MTNPVNTLLHRLLTSVAMCYQSLIGKDVKSDVKSNVKTNQSLKDLDVWRVVVEGLFRKALYFTF